MEDNQQKKDWYPITLAIVATVFTIYCLFPSGIVRRAVAFYEFKKSTSKTALTNFLATGTTEIAFDANDNLTAIPQEIATATKLESLTVNNLPIASIPEFIGNLSNLTKLTITNTMITNLPPQISALKQLTYLDLSNNKLTNVPQEISSLTNLKLINLSGNAIPYESIDILKSQFPQAEIIY